MRRKLSRPLVTSLTIFVSAGLAVAAEKKAEPIPVRNPAPGEMRPTWWLSCWMDHVVVVQGTLEYTTTNADTVMINLTPEAYEKHYQREEDRKIQKALSTVYIGDLTVEKVLFVAPGIEFEDGNVGAMVSGERRKTKVLVPSMEFDGQPSVMNLHDGKPNKGVFVFRYGSPVLQFPLVYDEIVPPEQVQNIEKVFAYRRKFDHIRNSDAGKSGKQR